MKNNIKRIVHIGLIISLSIYTHAQKKDFGSRLGMCVSSEWINDLKWSLELEQRFKDNSTRPDRTLMQAGLDYKLTKHLELGAAYRLASLNIPTVRNEVKHRFHSELSYSTKLFRIKPSLRVRYQYGGDHNFMHTSTNTLLRQRIKIAYNCFALPLSPYASTEIFKELRSNTQGAFQAYRSTIGTKFKMNKSLAFDFSFLIDKEINKPSPESLYALCFSINYDF